MVNVSTIQVSIELKNALEKRKMSSESYEDVIWDVLEDTMELSDETKNRIAIAEKEYAQGKYKTLEEVKKEMGL
jgi:predicted urease superfamily metal-dependent hydrolase